MSRPAISYPIPSSDEPPPLSLSLGAGGSSYHSAYTNPPHSPLAHSHSQSQNPPISPAHAHHSALFQSQRDASGSGSSSGGAGAGRQVSGPRGPTSTLDSYITRLLVVTKQLLQGLEQWSQRTMSEEHVSDIYVRLGNGFELCVSTFRRAGISTADLDSVPSDLREILERALAEEPSQDTLNIYLPDIRAIIFNLLNGLKNKQIAYKRQIADRQPLEPLPPPAMPAMPTNPTPTRPQPRQQSDSEARSIRSITSDGPASPASSSGTLPARAPPATVLAERSQHRTTRPAPPDAFRPSRSRPLDGVAGPRTLSSGSMDGRVGARATSPIPSVHSAHSIQGTPPTGPVPGPGPPRQPRRPERTSRDSTSRDSTNVTSRFSADSDVSALSSQRPPSDGAAMPMPIPIPHPHQHQHQHQNPLPLPPGAGPSHMPQTQAMATPMPVATPTPPPPPPQPPTPSTPPSSSATVVPGLPTLNLPDQGETETLNGVSAPLVTDDVHPTARSSFALLQRSEALERRASKRFSSYTFNKMVGSSSPNGKKASSSGTGSPPRPARRSNHGVPPMPSLTEAHAGRGRGLSVSADGSAGSTPSMGMSGDMSPVGLGIGQLSLEPQRRGSGSEAGAAALSTSLQSGSPMPSPTPALSVTAFLQLGRQVKKTTVELPLTMSSLRLLFMERFEYDPGMEDFPDVYIKDPKTGVQYELEDMDDVKDGCVLCLDIEPLDQVKQHFDLTFASLAQDIKELKTSLSAAKRMSTSTPAAPSLLAISPVMTSAAPMTPEQPRPPTQRTASGRIAPAAELRVHYDEVQSLRRDVAILRQLHVDFLSQTKESFAALRAQNTAMREVVKTKMGGNRALLDNSKAKLEGQCQDTIQAVEEVSDIIDGAREDALRRGITPPRGSMEKIRADLERATALVDEFSSDVKLAEPTWRATWMSELQRVTEEQRLLAYQNKLAADLKNDIKDATDMLDNVRAFVGQRAAAGGRRFQPPPPPETGGGIGTLLMEIRTKESDPNQRLRAIEERARARERDLASRTDDFQDELGAFVTGKKLRKTGGTDEAERIRQRRHDQTVRRMLSGDGPGADEPLSPQITGASARS